MANLSLIQWLIAGGLGLIVLGALGGMFRMKDKTKMGVFVLGSILALVGGVGASGWSPALTDALGGGSTAFTITPSVSDVVSQPVSTDLCPDTRVSTARIALKDEFASTNTFVASSVVYLFTQSNGFMERLNGSTGNGGYDLNISVTCPKTYDVVAVTQAGVVGSAQVKRNVDGLNEFIELVAPQISPLTVRIKDLSVDTYQTMFANGNSDMDTANTTSYTVLNYTHVFADNTGKANNLTINQDGFIDLNIYLKTNDVRQTAGEHAPFYACIDLNWNSSTTTNWDLPVVDYKNVRLSDVKGTIDGDSLSGSLVGDSEYCYRMVEDATSITDSETILHTKFTAKSGTNPSTSDSIAINLLPQGKYYSTRVPNVIKQGIYNDNSTSRTLVGVAGDRTPALVIHVD